MPVLPSGQGHVYPHVSRVPGPDGHVASDVAKLSLSRYSDLGQQYAKYPGRKGAATSEVSQVSGEKNWAEYYEYFRWVKSMPKVMTNFLTAQRWDTQVFINRGRHPLFVCWVRQLSWCYVVPDTETKETGWQHSDTAHLILITLYITQAPVTRLRDTETLLSDPETQQMGDTSTRSASGSGSGPGPSEVNI